MFSKIMPILPSFDYKAVDVKKDLKEKKQEVNFDNYCPNIYMGNKSVSFGCVA